MQKTQFNESQIVQILAEYNAGTSMEKPARRRACKYDSSLAIEVRGHERKRPIAA